MDGAAGSSGLDATAWKRICTSFKAASADLCESLANTARRLCSEYVDPSALVADSRALEFDQLGLERQHDVLLERQLQQPQLIIFKKPLAHFKCVLGAVKLQFTQCIKCFNLILVDACNAPEP